jgi:hypothetical protein
MHTWYLVADAGNASRALPVNEAPPPYSDVAVRNLLSHALSLLRFGYGNCDGASVTRVTSSA